ncbi:LysR family transcriptional regulator [Sphingomonas sp. Leaf17]|uniref:LysR family transcriptional regulator n=1 Tax=Sphingomonas sp. Leaf17 TaxID=1735683 RepID=UPI0006F53811|nr:LysR family transcriptional regulator [Sphingomonas sp. Leaf17]KQM64379.1 LysR family transcriptional regulator [Sphingomonas sp. Leaf17]
MIDRYQLRYFLAVVDHGNFSRAAERCNVSQPTLSVGIAKLERFLGAPLFLRSSQRVELTPAGSRFLLHARRIEGEFNQALQAMTDIGPAASVLRIGVLRSISGALLARAAAGMRAADPAAQVELVEGSERELNGHVARGRVDCALTLVERGGDRFLEQPLFEEGYALALPADHPLAGEAVVAAESLADNTMIVRRHCEMLSDTSRHFIERGVRPHFAYRATNDERVMLLVAAGLGVTVMPERHRHPGLTRPRLAGFDARRTVGLIFGAQAEHLAGGGAPFLHALRMAAALPVDDGAA